MKTYSAVPGQERSKTIPCSLCGGRRHRKILTSRNYTFVRCVDCGLAFQNPQPLFDDLKQRYGQNYFEYELENEKNFFHLMKLGLQDIRLFERTAELRQERRFLDVGCATGMLLQYLLDRGWSVNGVELCRESAEYGMRTRNIDIFVGTLEEARFPESHFSVIHFSHLIEHVPDPKAFFSEVRRILVPGGYLVVVTPNIDGLQARLFREKWRSAIADHLTLFSKKTLHKMLVATGFQIIKTVTWGGLAVGSAPMIIKRPVDRLAKRLGFGDVVLMLAGNTKTGMG
ncbi:MAG: class I SAM-dependent methyltransferase [Spirochaetaceae bacterium]|nr:MAG: class I SAM-dependent methyltransferase [Spirochaetaceae bacterium]